MLIRKCDMCKEEMEDVNNSNYGYWEVRIKYITMGKSNSKTGTYINLEMCDKCYKNLKF